ncbi:MAG TPA: hypothetical protein VKG23_04025 [Thermoanaerobaculia bacterium]|nr:hypothetical protein [Thermoanaerobaculia bacterium]
MAASRPSLRAARLRAATVALAAVVAAPKGPAPQPVAVRYPEGITHGFLVLRTLEGAHLADGDLIQTAHGEQVTSRMVLRFLDGSLSDETVVFSQRGHFRLLSDHLVQKGPSFPVPLEASIDAVKGTVAVRWEEKGETKTANERFDPPPDLANGFVATLVKNLDPERARSALSIMATAPKPRLVRLIVAPAGIDEFAVGDSRRKARKFVVQVDLGGVTGAVAPLVGKQPPDTYLWISEGDAPTFVKSEGPFYVGGPSWKLELAVPSWPQSR